MVTTDAIVAGVHFLPDTRPDLVSRRLLRTNLSDLAAKAAEPWLWWLTVAWPQTYDLAAREAFARGLADEQDRYGLQLVGGDTVRTPGPLTASATLVGRVPAGAAVLRSGARAGDVLLVSGSVGDAGLGLRALQGGFEGSAGDRAALVLRHSLPEPRLALRAALRAHAAAAADVSDGLLADAGRIALASGVAVEVDLDAVPLSPAAARWLERATDPVAARLDLATAGDDYEVVCACRPASVRALHAAAADAGVPLSVIGGVREGAGVHVSAAGVRLRPDRLGWTHE